MRVVFDTNVYVSAFVVPGSQGERALVLARRRRFELHTSVPILTELANKLSDKFGQLDEDVKTALKLVSRAATIAKPGRTLDVLSDEPDNRILECAVEVTADVIVTGDRHLLDLKEFRGTAILRLADFLRLFPDDEEERAQGAASRAPAGKATASSPQRRRRRHRSRRRRPRRRVVALDVGRAEARGRQVLTSPAQGGRPRWACSIGTRRSPRCGAPGATVR